MNRGISPRVVFAFILVAGAFLRWRGIDWGLPWALHIDERLFVAEKAMALEKSLASGGLPDPGISSYGILPLWLVALLRTLFLDAAMKPGPPVYGNELAATILLARIVSCAAGIALIPVTFWWARRFGQGTALTAAALVAGFPALVQVSHFGTVESLLLLLLAGGMLAGERLAEATTRLRAFVAGIVAGAALSVKLPGVFLLPALVHASRRRFLLVAIAAAAVVVALNPALLGNLFRAKEESPAPLHTTLEGNLRRAYSGDFHDWTLAYANDVPLVPELFRILPYGVGVLPEIFALAGLAIVFQRRLGPDVRLLLFLAPCILSILFLRAHTVRFLLPIFPALAILAALGARAVPLPGVSVFLAATTLIHGFAFSSIYVGEDPRIAAAQWLEEHAGARELVVVEDPPGYGPPLGSPSPEIPRRPLRLEILWRNFYSVHERRTEEERRAHIREMLEKADVLVLSEGHRTEFMNAGQLRPAERELYENLDSGRLPFRRVAHFENEPRLGALRLPDRGAETLMRVFDHPRIEIWRRHAEAPSE